MSLLISASLTTQRLRSGKPLPHFKSEYSIEINIVILIKVILRGRAFATSVMVNNTIMAIGGREEGETTLSSTEIWRGNDHGWVIGPQLPFPIEQHCSVSLNKTHIILVGGLKNVAPIDRFDGGIILDVR